jgi:hypothetical protein
MAFGSVGRICNRTTKIANTASTPSTKMIGLADPSKYPARQRPTSAGPYPTNPFRSRKRF